MAEKNNTDKEKNHVHTCPYCDAEIRAAAFPYCVACSVNFITCPSCGMDYSRDIDHCPECGAETRKPIIGI